MPALHSFKSNIDLAALVIKSHMFELPWGKKKNNCSTFRMVQNVNMYLQQNHNFLSQRWSI